MQLLDSFRKALGKIAAGTHGQTRFVRTVQGRQMFFLNQNNAMFIFPYLPGDPTPLQVTDPTDINFGMDYTLGDMHPADDTNSLAP